MPFTFSHPALVLPLRYLPARWVSFTGLIVGSMTPDFEYFIRMKIQSMYSHSLEGVFWYDLPLGLLLCFLFHDVVRNSLFDNLPLILKSRVVAFKQFDWNQYFRTHWLVVIVSILMGTFSHLLWDSFTHGRGYFVSVIPGMTHHVFLLGVRFEIYRVLQHVSTLIGGLVLAVALFTLPADRSVTVSVASGYWKYWGTVISLAAVMVTCRLVFAQENIRYGDVIVTVISAGMVAAVITPLLYFRSGR